MPAEVLPVCCAVRLPSVHTTAHSPQAPGGHAWHTGSGEKNRELATRIRPLPKLRTMEATVPHAPAGELGCRIRTTGWERVFAQNQESRTNTASDSIRVTTTGRQYRRLPVHAPILRAVWQDAPRDAHALAQVPVPWPAFSVRPSPQCAARRAPGRVRPDVAARQSGAFVLPCACRGSGDSSPLPRNVRTSCLLR